MCSSFLVAKGQLSVSAREMSIQNVMVVKKKKSKLCALAQNEAIMVIRVLLLLSCTERGVLTI